MKVSIVGPGIMPIPPTGWGAVEILIWDQKLALEKLGHEVQMIFLRRLMNLGQTLYMFNMMTLLNSALIYSILMLLPVILDT